MKVEVVGDEVTPMRLFTEKEVTVSGDTDVALKTRELLNVITATGVLKRG